MACDAVGKLWSRYCMGSEWMRLLAGPKGTPAPQEPIFLIKIGTSNEWSRIISIINVFKHSCLFLMRRRWLIKVDANVGKNTSGKKIGKR
jgi:hypothetical protein